MSETPAHRSITIGENEANQRFDRFLRKLLDDVSLSAIYKLMRKRRITLNHKKAKPETRLAMGDVVTFLEAAEESHFRPRAQKRSAPRASSAPVEFRVIHEDSALLVVNKPPGLLVHPGRDGRDRTTLIDQATAYLLKRPVKQGQGSLRELVKPSPTFSPGLVHRLDRNTSGLVMIGRTLPAMQNLTAMVRKRRIAKTYLAMVVGGLPRGEGVIEVPIARKESAGGKRRKVETGHGRPATTRYRVIAQRGHFSLVELELITGRTHQLRAHMAHVNAPIVGDQEYGDHARNRHARETLGLRRQFLHAGRLEFDHPLTGEPLVLTGALWPDLRQALEAAGFRDKDLPAWVQGA